MYNYKICPFCGTAPKAVMEVTRWCGEELTMWIGLKCPKCHIQKGMAYKSTTGEIDFNDLTGYMNEVVNTWNDRYYCDDDLTK